MGSEALTRGVWPRVQWGPVIAGVLCALAAHIVLGLFGAAFGFAAAPADSKGLGIGAAVWSLITPLVASFIGAWVAVRIAGDRHEAGAMIHGGLVWCIGLIAGAVFLAGVMGSTLAAAGSAASGVGARAVAPAARSRANANATADDAAKGSAAATGAAGVAALLGLAGAALGAALARRQVTGEGLGLKTGRRHHAEARGEYGYPGARGEAGVAYGDERGVVTTRPPGAPPGEHRDDLNVHH